MIKYLSTKGGTEAVDFETAILNGFAADGGLYVPEYLPNISLEQLEAWSGLSYVDLAFEILSLFIDESVVPAVDLRDILEHSFSTFEVSDILPIYSLKSQKETYIMELFHGPTLSFKDVALGFLLNLLDFFLKRKKERLSVVIATTGDTGPAAGFAAVGKTNIEMWLLYPKGFITEEQERQMTTLSAKNVHPVAVENCPDGADDLDLVIARLFEDKGLVDELKLSSVNSINWGRVMMQTVHYFYAYLSLVDRVGEPIQMAVPCGAFGNLCAGTMARLMGLPVATFVCANNQNASLHRAFSEGIFSKKDILSSVSCAIDIVVPYNFWRYLYFMTGENPALIRQWMADFRTNGAAVFEAEHYEKISEHMLSASISDEATLNTIQSIYEKENYLLDPHSAVAVTAVQQLADQLSPDLKTVCLATAHPAKFPTTMRTALNCETLPDAAKHTSIENNKKRFHHFRLCDFEIFEAALIVAMCGVGEMNKMV